MKIGDRVRITKEFPRDEGFNLLMAPSIGEFGQVIAVEADEHQSVGTILVLNEIDHTKSIPAHRQEGHAGLLQASCRNHKGEAWWWPKECLELAPYEVKVPGLGKFILKPK